MTRPDVAHFITGLLIDGGDAWSMRMGSLLLIGPRGITITATAVTIVQAQMAIM